MRDWNKHQCLMFFLCFFFLSAGLSQRVYAVQSIAMGIDQQLQITGVVKDTNGEPMIGVTVMVKGTGTGTITDIDGKYSVSVPGNKSVLTFSFVGYTTKEVTVGNQKSINVTLSEDSKMIDEVVVIGFQSQKKGNLTASVASGVNELDSVQYLCSRTSLARHGSGLKHQYRRWRPKQSSFIEYPWCHYFSPERHI